MIHRGEIWWASLPDPRLSEPGYRRPVLVIQSDAFNRSNIRTVIAAPLTSNIDRAAAPGNVLVRRRNSKLAMDSVVNVSQLLALDRAFLTKRVSRLADAQMAEVDAGLRLVLAL